MLTTPFKVLLDVNGTQIQVCVDSPSLKRLARVLLLRQQETDFHQLSCGAPVLLLIGRYNCRRLMKTSPGRTTHSVVLNDHSRRNNALSDELPWQHRYFFLELANNSATHKIIYVMSGRHAKIFKFVY
ncbi:hypothetical protein TNCV_326821 [Trichonephila clavipes]|nr:hypothetical protein TNCV_326821 [Trichonephila clavipes]